VTAVVQDQGPVQTPDSRACEFDVLRLSLQLSYDYVSGVVKVYERWFQGLDTSGSYQLTSIIVSREDKKQVRLPAECRIFG
jgi:hypothetical protein